MPFIDMGDEFGNTKETPMAPEGEYDLVCGEPEHNTENGKNSLVIPINFENDGYAPFRHFLALPQKEKDLEKDKDRGNKPGATSKTKMLYVKRFCYGFSIPFNATGFETNDVPGARARLSVTQSEADDQGRIFQNLRTPRLPEGDDLAV